MLPPPRPAFTTADPAPWALKTFTPKIAFRSGLASSTAAVCWAATLSTSTAELLVDDLDVWVLFHRRAEALAAVA